MNYLLPCECGREHQVSPSKAGDSLVCECGKKLDIPPLRQLKELKPAEPDPRAAAPSEWSLRNGVLATGLILAALLAGVGGYWWAMEPAPPREFDPLATTQAVEQQLSAVTPADGYRQWVLYYKPLDQVQKVQNPQEAVITASIERHQMLRWGFLAAAAVVAALSAVGFLLMPSGKRRRG